MSQLLPKLIVGLANPGPNYVDTRHNAGEWLLQSLLRECSTALVPTSKFFGLSAKGFIHQHPVHFLIPTTFMNLSGKAVAALAQFYKISTTEILVLHDELDLFPGSAKIKQGGGHGGHNGLKDIISNMANQSNFYRLRLGIGHPGHKDKVVSWVLNKPKMEDRQLIDQVIDQAVQSILLWYQHDLLKAQQHLHSFRSL